jgi:redox-sensing transcriptional repressor
MGYRGFANHGLVLRAAFDVNPELAGTKINGVTIHALEKLGSRIRKYNVKMAILTVSHDAAQEVADRLVDAGIEGIWNFTGKTLSVPDDVIVQDQDIAIGLAVLSAKLSART